MRILVITQAVDLDNPVLGFFHRWIEEFSQHVESVDVICLREGRHALPGNVRVHSLGKEHGVSRATYLFRFYRHIWKLRNRYDSVFVHMNQEYVLLGALLWRLYGKKIVLWRNHAKGSWATRVAGALSSHVCYTSPQAFVAHFKNAVRMPVGIDTGLFKPGGIPAPDSILFLGRLDPVKNPSVFLKALQTVHDAKLEFRADIYGEPTDPHAPHVASFKQQAASLVESGILTLHRAVQNDRTPAIYAAHAVYVNLTPSGSFDKTIGEAMASGCVTVAANAALRGVIRDDLIVEPESAESVSRALRTALMVSPGQRAEIAEKSRAYILEHHSLLLLSQELMGLFSS